MLSAQSSGDPFLSFVLPFLSVVIRGVVVDVVVNSSSSPLPSISSHFLTR